MSPFGIALSMAEYIVVDLSRKLFEVSISLIISKSTVIRNGWGPIQAQYFQLLNFMKYESRMYINSILNKIISFDFCTIHLNHQNIPYFSLVLIDMRCPKTGVLLLLVVAMLWYDNGFS